MEVKKGDHVSVKRKASYYNGEPLAKQDRSKKWVVKSVEGSKAVISRHTGQYRMVYIIINTEYLKVLPASGQKNAVLKKAKDADTISINGINLITEFEGCYLEAYKCPAGKWTIGYGHTENVKQGDTLPSKKTAMDLLRKDLIKYEGYVNTCKKNGKISFQMTQNQFDALTSFVYNCGYSNLQTLVTGRNAETVAEKILLYNKSNGKVLPGLARRRKAEHDLFTSQNKN